jgi:hypothetical protein
MLFRARALELGQRTEHRSLVLRHIPYVVRLDLPFEVLLVEASNIVVDAPCKFLKYPLVNFIMCLLNPSLRSRAGS